MQTSPDIIITNITIDKYIKNSMIYFYHIYFVTPIIDFINYKIIIILFIL